MNNLNYEEKISLLFNLLQLTRVDHVESEVEVDFIYRIGERINVSKSDIDTIIASKAPFSAPKEENQRIVLFYSFLLVMGVDGHLSKEEVQFCNGIGFKLGLNPMAVQSLINEMMDNQLKKLPAQKVIEAFKLYHN